MRRAIGVHWYNTVEEKVEESKREKNNQKGRDRHWEGRGRREGKAAGLGRVLVVQEGS